MNPKQLETIEKIIDADPNWKIVREKIQKALDNQPKSVTLEEALRQVNGFGVGKKDFPSGQARGSQ